MEERWSKRGKLRHVLYLIGALAMLFYALSQMGGTAGEGASRLFWYVWLAFAAVVIAANVNMLLFVNEAKRKELARIKRAKAQLWERRIEKALESRKQRGRGRG